MNAFKLLLMTSICSSVLMATTPSTAPIDQKKPSIRSHSMLPDPQRQHPLGCGIGLVVPVHRTQAGFAIVPVKAKGARKNDRGPGVAPSFCFLHSNRG